MSVAPLPVTGMPAELIAALDARLAARQPRTQLTLAEHVARIAANGRRPLDRSEALALGYPPAEVLAVFGPERPDRVAGSTTDGPRVVHAEGHTHVVWGVYSVALRPHASPAEVTAAVAGIDAGVLQLAASLECALTLVSPPTL